MNTDKTKSLNTAESGNLAKPMLAVVVILLLWIMWFSTVGLLSEICDGKYFWERCLFITPFSYASYFISRVVWDNKR